MASSGSCPTPNTKCCAKEIVVDNPVLDGIGEALPVPDQASSNLDQFNTGPTFNLDNPDENSGNLALSTFAGDDQLFSNVSPEIGAFDDGEQLFDFAA